MAAAPAGAQNRCVFVGNIPYDATEEQLVQICEEVGPVVSFRLVIDKETGKLKGYGFCEYKDEETALSARRNLQGYEINGRQLRVDFAENGRNTDRNREKGRGGPGMASNVDGQKQLTGSSVTGDASLHQPVGLTPAIHAASVMAGVLGGAQTANVQNGLPVQYGLGNDPLTHYLARMSRHQLHEIMSELKSLATQNKELSKKLLQGIPQLPKALFQAQIMLGMVTPQMMQTAKCQQPSSSLPQPSSHLSEPFSQPDPMIQVVSRSSSLPLNIPANATVLQESTTVLQNFPQYQTSAQHSPLTHHHIPQAATTPETLTNEIRGADHVSHMAEFAHPAKLRKLDDGTSVPGMVTNNLPVYSAPLQVPPTGPSGGYNTASASIQQPENEVQQLTPDVESALLQQVLQLTPEQLSSLPPEQQQQVIQLQKMLSAGK